ncbi:MAG TPA: PPOX class F420-dependent oxidoreductase [Dehalococcoidia bacterium]|nr:PPOX class F420-dependent oxidoreductase [Dehalococcoidia bacterium]
MSAKLSQATKDLLEQPFLAHLVTLNPDGSPQVTPVWVDRDGDQILVNTAEGRKKPRNLQADKRVAVEVVDPSDPWKVLSLTGRVVAMEHDGADAHIDKLAKKYLGKDTYPFRRSDEQRVILRIEADRVRMQPA